MSKLMDYKCPSCNKDTVSQCEDAYLVRRVLGVQKDGDVVVSSEYYVDDDRGENVHLHCFSCGHNWELPPEVDFQYDECDDDDNFDDEENDDEHA